MTSDTALPAELTLNPDALMAALEANHAHKSDAGRKGCGIEKAIRAYLRALSATRTYLWEPIETAPKDGTSILLFWPNIPAGAKSMGSTSKRHTGISVGWFEASESGVGFISEGDFAVPSNQEDCTHWQPLPAPPITTEGE